MPIRIGDTQLSRLGQQTAVGGSARVRGNNSVEATLRSTDSDAARITLSQQGPPPEQSPFPGISSLLDSRKQAISAVSDLRSQQLELSERAEGVAVGRELTSISEQVSAIETEISRVTSSATFNGTNVLQGNVFGTLDTGNQGEGFVISVADANALANTEIDSISTPNDAVAVSNQLKQILTDVGRFEQDTEQAQEVASNPASTRPELVSEPRDQLSVEEADALAQSITQQLSQTLQNQFGAGTTSLSLIDALSAGLNPERVNELIQD